jgi:hypothetical protein
MSSLSRGLLAAAVSLSLLGAGCLSRITTPDQKPSGPQASEFENVTPAEASKRINLVHGSVIELRSTFLGFGAKLAAALAGEKKEGTRVIVIDRFAPGELAALEWKLSSKVEAESSIKAREAARKAKQPEPEPIMVDQTVLGRLIAINLKDAHALMLPAYWPEKADGSAQESSAIWLSKDVFDGLSRNRVATLDFGLLEPSFQGVVGTSADFKGTLATLQSQVKSISDRTDVFKLTGDADPIEWKLKVNGQDVTVEALKARTWFGEIVVLNNPQNPLILKATLNPAMASLANVLNLSALQALFGYEVTALNDVQM